MEAEKFREEVKNHPRTKAFDLLKKLHQEIKGSTIKVHKTEFSEWVNYSLENKKGEPMFLFVSDGDKFVTKQFLTGFYQ